MEAFFRSLAHNFRRLADFSGRERQILFWPYAGFIYGLATLVSSALVMAPIVNTILRMMAQIGEAARDGGEPDFVKSPELLTPDLGGLIVPIAVINALTILLLAAAVARRLHDKDRSGWWGLLPLPPMGIALALMPTTMASFTYAGTEPDPMLLVGMLNNLAYLGLLVGLVILLVGQGTTGPNRFGPETS